MSQVYFKKRKKKSSLKGIIFAGLFFCLLGGLIYFTIWSPILQIENIEIKSDKKPNYYTPDEIINIAKEELVKKIFNFIPQNTIVLAPVNRIKNAILEKFPEIKQINVSRKIPKISDLNNISSSIGLNIDIEERESIGIWCKVELKDNIIASSSPDKIIDQCFQIDRTGVIYRDSLLVEGSSILNIYSSKNQLADIKDTVLLPEVINFIIDIRKKAGKIKTDYISSVLLSDFDFISTEDLRGTTSWGLQIYLNPSISAEAQINALEAVLEEKIKQNYSSLKYIDLRIKGRAYYK